MRVCQIAYVRACVYRCVCVYIYICMCVCVCYDLHRIHSISGLSIFFRSNRQQKLLHFIHRCRFIKLEGSVWVCVRVRLCKCVPFPTWNLIDILFQLVQYISFLVAGGKSFLCSLAGTPGRISVTSGRRGAPLWRHWTEYEVRWLFADNVWMYIVDISHPSSSLLFVFCSIWSKRPLVFSFFPVTRNVQHNTGSSCVVCLMEPSVFVVGVSSPIFTLLHFVQAFRCFFQVCSLRLKGLGVWGEGGVLLWDLTHSPITWPCLRVSLFLGLPLLASAF